METADDNYDSDVDGDVYVDDNYPPELPYDLADLDSLTPGLLDLMGISPGSAAQLPGLLERVRVKPTTLRVIH